jgi:hypothetical protein
LEEEYESRFAVKLPSRGVMQLHGSQSGISASRPDNRSAKGRGLVENQADADLLPPTNATPGQAYSRRGRTASVVCYLDFDGVLHHDAGFRRAGRGIYIDPDLVSCPVSFRH